MNDTRTRKQKRRDRAEGAAEEAAWWGGCCCLDLFVLPVVGGGLALWLRRRL
ncbi:MAG TPA: hypothetical protein VK304_10290 [Thermoleophilaceae bacterium]|nr:hypothetical protein [Thermoleophilaceae bacterium]